MTHGADTHLKKSLNAFHLWGIAVGLVISGEYFGWSYGWATAGTLGFLAVTAIVAAMYIAFIFSFTELTTAIPQAGGPFAYAYRAFGPWGGAIAGFATLIEFVFAPPAISLAIGAYLAVQFPSLDPRTAALGAYAIFVALNIVGVGIAATFELFVTILAVGELLVFMKVVAPIFSLDHFVAGGWAGSDTPTLRSLGGMFAAIPFAIWFFLAIEGVAMAAEEAKEPRRTIPIAYVTGIVTLTALAFGVMILAGGSGDWKGLSTRCPRRCGGRWGIPAAGCTCWSGWVCSASSPRSTASSWAMPARCSPWRARVISRLRWGACIPGSGRRISPRSPVRRSAY